MSTTETTLLEGGGSQLADRINTVSSNILAAKESLRQAILAKESTCTENPTFAELKSGIENIQSGAILTLNKEKLRDVSQDFSWAQDGYYGYFSAAYLASDIIYYNGYAYSFRDSEIRQSNLASSTYTTLSIVNYIPSYSGYGCGSLIKYSESLFLLYYKYKESNDSFKYIYLFNPSTFTFSLFLTLPYSNASIFKRENEDTTLYNFSHFGSYGYFYKITYDGVYTLLANKDVLVFTNTTKSNTTLVEFKDENHDYTLLSGYYADTWKYDFLTSTLTSVDYNRVYQYSFKTMKGIFMCTNYSSSNQSQYLFYASLGNFTNVNKQYLYTALIVLSQKTSYGNVGLSSLCRILNTPFYYVYASNGSNYGDYILYPPRYILPVYTGCTFCFDKEVWKEIRNTSQDTLEQYKCLKIFQNVSAIPANTETVAEEGYYYYIIDPEPTGYIKYI